MAFSTRRAAGPSHLPALRALGGESTIAELNITPMIDVMLALLIIFMVVTPVLTEYAATLPAARHPVPQTLDDAVTLGIDRHGLFFVGADTIAAGRLAERLARIYAARPGDHVLYLRADRGVPYRLVLDAVDAARAAGVRTIGAISLPVMPGDTGRARAP
jgi:biopolymer transport protein TolR